MINEAIKEEAELVQKMIFDFFINECQPYITKQHIGLIKTIFNRTSVTFSNSISSNGSSYHDSRTIKVKTIWSLNTERVLSILIHEYAHMFMEKNYDYYSKIFPEIIREGMCDTFSDLVMNYYFTKNQRVFCKGRYLNVSLPYESCSRYKYHTGWVKTLLYPLEKQGKDKKAIVSLLLNVEPLEFFEYTLGSNFLEFIDKDELGFPINFEMTYKNLYELNQSYFHNIDKKSFYYQRNFILAAFAIQEKIKNTEETPIYNLGSSVFNANFINNIYFKEKKLYEIPTGDLQEFVDLYYQSSTNEKSFIIELPKFLYQKINELEKEEIRAYSFPILSNMKVVLKGIIEYESNVNVLEQSCSKVLMECLMQEINKLAMYEQIEIVKAVYSLIYPDYQEILRYFKEDDTKLVMETFQNVEIFFIEKMTFLNTESRVIGEEVEQKGL